MASLLNILSQSSLIVTASTAAAWLYRMDFHATAFVSGALACAALGRVLKDTIRQPRPKTSPKSHNYGMPSSHAQTISYFGVHLALSAGYFLPAIPQSLAASIAGVSQQQISKDIFLHAVDNMTSYWRFSPTQQDVLCYAVQAASLLLAGAIAWSRYKLQYHTASQVLAGCSIGSLFAIVWFRTTFAVLQPLYESLV